MNLPDWREEPIAKKYDRDSFDCGDSALNEFLQRHARQNHEKGASKTFLAVSNTDSKTILGFYSLSPASIDYARIPEIIRRGFARYEIPVFRLGRLAVDHRFQRQGVGGKLLMLAGRRCLHASVEVGGIALLIDAKNERVAHWYATYGAIPLPDTPLVLLLPLSTIDAALRLAK